ncbi:ead/Ea22-like family protein [Salmonella enterica]|nr:ead/Ea22-like family protein [Salmonella enterica subsp. enterica serovar Teddington]ECE1929284.1 ead/Ea22-like family protein [Salmonella enterica]EHS6172711.1 ead/Ea22-like family protein [Salmonella enterica]
MSNDISALARTLRQAAEEELMCREASDTSDLWQDEASPENVLALVEALEILQQENRVSELESDLAAEEERRGNWFRMAEELGGKLDAAEEHIRELDKRLIEYAGIATREARRVAELEARTVSIPEVRITVAESKRKNLTWRELGAYNEGADVAKEKILAAIRAAGIKVKGE